MKTVFVHAFISEVCEGSPQFLHFYSTLEQRNAAWKNTLITDEFDHSFIYFSSGGKVEIAWKNKASSIELCGSGAYAAAWWFFREHNFQKMILSYPGGSSVAYRKNDTIFLELPSQTVALWKPVSLHTWYRNLNKGVYLVEAKSIQELKKISWVEDTVAKLNPPHQEALCAYHWDSKENQGFLRYFTPWHGRDEDYVTGSIQSYLSPLVGRENQNWVQLSSRGGVVHTSLQGDCVLLDGKCKIDSKF